MSDDDLIRRSDSIRIVETFGHDKQMVLDTLRALPATDARNKTLREFLERMIEDECVNEYSDDFTKGYVAGLISALTLTKGNS